MASSESAAPTRGSDSLQAQVSGEGLFVRKSSGLVRDIGATGAVGMNLGALSIGAALGYFAIELGLFPGVNITVSLLVGGLLMVAMGLVYVQLGSTMPRSGGDYVFQARIFSPVVGAWVGGALVLLIIYSMAAVTSLFVEQFVTFGLATLGGVFHWNALVNLAGTVGTHGGTFVTGAIFLLISLLCCLEGPKVAARVTWYLALLGIVGVVVMIVDLLINGGAAFRHAVDASANQPHAYQAVIAQARAHGWKPGFSASATINAIPYSYLAFGGFWYVVFNGGELKRPARTLKTSAFAALFIALTLVLLTWLVMEAHSGIDFLQASSALQSAAPSVYSKITSLALGPQSYAVLVAGDPVTKLVIAVAFIAWLFPPQITYMTNVSRLLFAFSFDRLLPERVAQVSRRRSSPVIALGITFGLTLALFALITYSTGIANAFRNITLVFACTNLLACVAVVALPYRRRRLFEASPKVLAGKSLGVPRIVYVGVGAIALNGFIVYLTLTKGQYSGGYSATSILTVAIMGTAGVFVYATARGLQRKRGIDVKLAMRELPPE